MRLAAALFSMVAVAAGAFGCSSGRGSVGGCPIVGASVACACTDGRTGAQVCQPNGTLGPCLCAPGGDIDAGSGAGGASANGGAGGGDAGAALDAIADAASGGAGGGIFGGDAGLDSGRGGGGGGIFGRDAGVDLGRDAGVDVALAPIPRTQIYSGTALLIGNGPNSCTSQVPAPGDRWCGFVRPSAKQGFIELWVVNVSRAIAGTTPVCDGSDPNCILLTGNAFVDDSSGFQIDGFDGDTLIYYADTGPTFVPSTATVQGSGFIGTVYAWRPGWTAGRPLTANTGVVCIGQAKAAVALCFDNGVTTSTQLTYDLRGGLLPAPGGALLPTLDTLLLQTINDPAGVTKFEANFSPDGAYVAWSARPTATGVETLKVLRIGDAAPTTVASDVSRWLVSPDVARWYWLRGYNYSTTGAGSGTLQTAVFPGGGAPVTVATSVGDFDAAGTRGLIFRDGLAAGRGALKQIPDRDAFTAVTTLDTGVAGVLDVSQDGRRALFAKTFDSTNNLVDLFVAPVPGGTPPGGRCTISATVTVPPLASFLTSGTGAAWAQVNLASGLVTGMFANTNLCISNAYASNILSWAAVGDEGFIYGDDSTDGLTATLRYSKVVTGSLPAGPAIQPLADAVFASLLPALPAVVYVVDDATGNPGGVWVSAPLPFTAGQ